MVISRLARLGLLGACAAAVGACNPAPRSLSDEDLSSADAVRAAAPEYWRDRAPEFAAAGSRVVLAEFAVEFVTQKYETGKERQAAFVPPHPVFLAAGAAGIGLKRVEFPEDAFPAIAAELERTFRAEATRLGLTLVDAPDMQRDPAGQPRVTQEINFGATDTGRVKELRLEPGPATPLLAEAASRDTRDAVRAALTDTGADAAVRVHLRVGVYRGYASCEYGSRIEVYTPNDDGKLVSRATLLSAGEVLTDDASNGLLPVDQAAYASEIATIAPAYLRMAILAARED